MRGLRRESQLVGQAIRLPWGDATVPRTLRGTRARAGESPAPAWVLAGLLIGLLAFGAGAQQGQVGGPVSGYVFDVASHLLRPLLGTPGAAIVGQAVVLPFTAASVAVSPKLDLAVALADDGSPHLLRLAGGAASEIVYNSALGHAAQAVFSPSGSAVALVGGSTAEIVTGLPDAPQMAGTVDLGAARFHSLALSDDGAWLLTAGPGTVRAVGTAGGVRTLMSGVRTALAVFAPGSHQAAILAGGDVGLALVRDVAGTGTPETLASSDAVLAAPAGLSFSADGRSVLVAAGNGRIAGFDVAGGMRGTWSCDCTVTGLTRMGGVFRLNELGGDPLWLLNPESATAGIVFVPALTASAN